MGNKVEEFFDGLYYGFARFYSMFPNLEYEPNSENSKSYEKILSKLAESKKNEKEFQIPLFLIDHLDTSKINDVSLKNFIKLGENKKAMELIFKKFSKVVLNEYQDISFDEFMKTNPDSELQSIFFLLLMNEMKSDLKILIGKNFFELDKRAQFDVLRQMIRNMKLYSILNENNNLKNNLNDIYPYIFQKFSENKIDRDTIEHLIDGSVSIEEIDKLLINFKDSEIQSLFCFYIFRIRKGISTEDILRFNKRIQIDILKEFSNQILTGGPVGSFFEKVDFQVRIKFLEYIIISGKIELFCDDKKKKIFIIVLFSCLKMKKMKLLNVYYLKYK